MIDFKTIKAKHINEWALNNNHLFSHLNEQYFIMGAPPINESFPIWAKQKGIEMTEWWYVNEDREFRYVEKNTALCMSWQ